MKKVLAILILASCLQANAQSDASWKFGPRLGVNFSTLSDVDDAKMKAGLVAGGYFVYSFQEHFGISVDLLYSQEGAKYKSSFSTNGIAVTSENDQVYSYLRVPVLFNVFGGELGNSIRPKLVLGPALGFLLGAKSESTVTTISNGNTVTETMSSTSKDGLNSVDFGAVAGLGVNIRLAERLWLDTDLRYYLGASDVYENNVGDQTPKNRSLQLSFGLGIGLNR